MLPVLSREQIREFDRHAIDAAHVPSLVLMENAGRGATEAIVELLDDAFASGAGRGGEPGGHQTTTEPTSCCIVCGHLWLWQMFAFLLDLQHTLLFSMAQ